MENGRIIRDIYLPTPPDGKGNWADKGRDHAFFQKNVLLPEQLGGIPGTAGCLTQGGEAARRAAEDRFLRSQDISHSKNTYRDN